MDTNSELYIALGEHTSQMSKNFIFKGQIMQFLKVRGHRNQRSQKTTLKGQTENTKLKAF